MNANRRNKAYDYYLNEKLHAHISCLRPLLIIQTYSQNYFIKYFLGLDLNTNSLTEATIPDGWDDIIDWEEVINMPSYPYSGSIRKIAENGEDGKIFFVRLGRQQ